MKKVLRNKSLIAIALFTVFTVALAPVAMANSSNTIVPMELKFLGNVNNKPLFQLNVVGNAEENEFTIAIIDEFGNRLYKETIKGENFSKRFLIDTETLGDTELRFEITSNKSSKPVVFETNRESRLVEEVVVNKVK